MTVCTHGQLARSCELCEKDQRIAELAIICQLYTQRDAGMQPPPVARPEGHDAAQARIDQLVREIQIICGEFGYDASQYLQGENELRQ